VLKADDRSAQAAAASLCAEVVDGPQGLSVCGTGDSGGPLVCSDDEDYAYAVAKKAASKEAAAGTGSDNLMRRRSAPGGECP
jgi:hypothetical protein